jgi:cytochrome c biogenesis protein CcmG/thiol:disulfide interchange protein DsbE
MIVSAANASTLDLAPYRGKVVYLDFWASWCVPCRQSFPWMNGLNRELHEHGLQIVAVNVDREHADAARFLETTAPTFPIVFDPVGTLAEHWRVKGMPTSFLIGRDGKIVAVHPGFRPKDRELLERTIRTALASPSANPSP